MTSDVHSRSWFRRHRTLFLGLVVILLFITLLLSYSRWQNHRLKKQITAHLETIRAQGYPVTLAELDAWYVTPPAPENAALEIIAASRQITDYWTHGGQWLDINYSNNLHEAELPLSQPARTALASIIHSNQTVLRLTREGLKKPQFRFPVNYAAYDFGSVNTVHRQIMELNMLLRWELFHHQAEGQTEAAMDSITTRLQLADTLSTEPTLMSLLTRNGFIETPLRNLSTQLSSGPVSSNSLIRLLPLLAALDQKTSVSRALAGERVCDLAHWEKNIRDGGYSDAPFDHWPTNLHVVGQFLYTHGGHQTADQLHYLELLSAAITSAETSSAALLKFAAETERKYPKDTKPAWDHIYTHNFGSILPWLIRNTLSKQAQCRLARVAVAVEEYWNHHGKLPNQMTDLVPAYLDKIPDDPFSTSGVLYQRTAEGYRIYSIDEDGLDDGGKDHTERKKPLTSDLVFKVESTNQPRTK
jgi:hypothetical protein